MAVSAKERKEAYVRRMCNRGREMRPKDVERSPVTVYLSDEARRLLKVAKRRDRNIGVTPCSDSVFVEEAIRRLAERPPVLSRVDPDQVIAKARELQVRYEAELDAAGVRLFLAENAAAAAERRLADERAQRTFPFDRRFLDLAYSLRRLTERGLTHLEEAQQMHQLINAFAFGEQMPGQPNE